MNAFARPRVLAAAAGLTLALTLTACGGTDTASTSAATTGSTGTVPTAATTGDLPDSTMSAGMTSGDPMTGGMAGGTAPTTGADTAHNDADVMFVEQMLPHHEGAIEMADLAPDRAADQAVKDLAAQIKAAQQPEIDEMNGWLAAWNAAMSGSGMDMGTSTTGMDMGTSSAGMDMGSASAMSMDGMMSDDDMAALTAATGADFDRLFLELMITHHQGAVDMAEVEIGSGTNPDALALAASIRSTQTAEIATMEGLLAGM